MWRIPTIVFSVLWCLGSPFGNALRIERSSGVQDAEVLAGLASRLSQWECTSDSDCTANNSSCVDAYCGCDAGYIFNTAMTACIRAATAYGDECEETLQCTNYLLTGAACDDNVCVCGTGYHYVHGRCYPSSGLGEECAADVNCYVNADIEATSCVNGVCRCSDGFYQREYRTCRRAGYAVGDECTVDIDCLFDNAYCTTDRVCALNVETRAVEEEEEEEEEEVTVASRLLRADAVLVGDACTNDTDCNALGNARCGSFGTCVCNRANYASSNLTSCEPELGEECSDNDSVVINNSICRNGTWSCGYATVFSTNNRICRKTTKHYNWSCLHDEQCYIFGPDASCQSKRCLCNEGSHLVESELFCWVNRGIGESCQATEDCYMEGVNVTLTCSNAVCSCPEGSHPNSDNTGCKDDAAVLGGTCEEDNDCTVTNSGCINEICTCQDNHYESDGNCYAGINATCSTDSDCTATNSVCTSEVCACTDDHVAYSSSLCVPVLSYGDECTYDIQCYTGYDNTVCTEVEDEDTETGTDVNTTNTTTKVCACDPAYRFIYDACRVKRVLGETCASAGECYVESDSTGVLCLSGTCTCGWDYTQINTTYCRISGATTALASTWMCFVLVVTRLISV